MKTLVSFLFVILFPFLVSAQTDDFAIFVSLMKTEFEAFQKKDPALWINSVDDNAIFTGADNSVKTKDQIIEEMKNAPAIFASASEEYENVITKVYRNTAVLSCVTTFSFSASDGKLNSIKFKFTRVHVKEGNEWKLVYHSAIPIGG